MKWFKTVFYSFSCLYKFKKSKNREHWHKKMSPTEKNFFVPSWVLVPKKTKIDKKSFVLCHENS